jgi:segregation and condensation protein B
LDTAEIKGAVECLVFASDAPLRVERIAEVLEIEKSRVSECLRALAEEYAVRKGGIALEEVAEGFQFRTRPEYSDWVRRLVKNRPFRFSRAALETLAIIAYRQPITRAEIEYLRGVDSGGVLKTLLDKRLVKILGKKDVPGRPMIYGTSREFLEFFALKNLVELPTLKEFSELPMDALSGEDISDGPFSKPDGGGDAA